MRIYRIAAMFQTFGLEDKLVKSFIRHYSSFVKSISGSAAQRKAVKEYNRDGHFYVGSANVTDALAPIVEHYGEPQLELPKRVYFLLIHPDNPNYDKTSTGFFVIGKDGQFYILKRAADLLNVKFDSLFENTMRHETQHFLKSLYEGGISKSSVLEEGSMESYYGDPWEIQAYAGNVANDAMENIKSLLEIRMSHKSPEFIEKIKGNMRRDKTLLVKSFLFKNLNNFFSQIENTTKQKFSPELKRKYYEASLRDFSRLFDEYFA